MSESLKKMSAKRIMGCDPKLLISEVQGETVLLYIIYGTATDVRSGEHPTYGPWSALIGNFEAIRATDGVVFGGAQAFLPEPVHSMIVSQIREAGDPIRFEIKVLIKTDKEMVRGYEYLAEPIRDPTIADPLENMRKQALLMLKSLPSPDSDTDSKKAKK